MRLRVITVWSGLIPVALLAGCATTPDVQERAAVDETKAESPTASQEAREGRAIVVKSNVADFPVGLKLDRSRTITLQEGDLVTVLTKEGSRTMRGPGAFKVAEQARSNRSRFANLTRDRAKLRAKTGAVRGAGKTKSKARRPTPQARPAAAPPPPPAPPPAERVISPQPEATGVTGASGVTIGAMMNGSAIASGFGVNSGVGFAADVAGNDQGSVRAAATPPAAPSAPTAAPSARTPMTAPAPTGARTTANPAARQAREAPPTADPCAAGEPPSFNLPRYEPWPPEQASSRIPIDDLIGARGSLTLYQTGQALRRAMNLAGYQQHSFYAVPGGYIIVTETERTDPEGAGVSGKTRYMAPGEDRTALWLRVRDLFLERPKTYYRYLAIVVTDRPFCVSRQTLDIDEARTRVLGGFTDLSDDTKAVEFGDQYRVTALVYEFQNDGVGYDLSMIAPGRIAPLIHLERSGLAKTIPQVFAQARRGDQ